MSTTPKITTAKKAAAAKAAPKKPADHQPKEVTPRPEDTPGWELMKPFSDIPVWDQMPLMAMLHEAMDDSEIDYMDNEEFANLSPEERKAKIAEAGETRDFDIRILGQLAFELKKFAIDEEAYTKFCSGTGAMERSLNLAMAWVGQMGESVSSENS